MISNNIGINEANIGEIFRMVYSDEMNLITKKDANVSVTDGQEYCSVETDAVYENILDSDAVMDGCIFSKVAMKHVVDGYLYHIDSHDFRLIFSTCSRFICKCVSLYDLLMLDEDEIEEQFKIVFCNFAHLVFFWRNIINKVRDDELALRFIDTKMIGDSKISYQQRCLDGIPHAGSIRLFMDEVEERINQSYPQHVDATNELRALVLDMFKKSICTKTFRTQIK